MRSVVTITALIIALSNCVTAQTAPKQEPKPEGRQITDAERQSLRREDASEAEAAILPYLNNFFATTRLGPEDIITVDVFNQPNYSRQSLTVPPDGAVSYPLVGRVLVAGRTTTELEKELAEKLSEYIIDPKVSVQLVASHSQKIFVIGDVNTPGMYEMTRRMTATEALARAGYITKFGDKKKIHVLRAQPKGDTMVMPLDMTAVEKGKAPDMYLVPGDTIVVPGNLIKKIDQAVGIVLLGYWMRVLVR